MVPISIRVIWIIQIIISSVFFIFSVGHSPKASCFLANRLAVEHCSFIFVICLRRISLNEWLFLLWKYYNMVLCFNSKSEVRHVTMKPAVTTFSQPVFDRRHSRTVLQPPDCRFMWEHDVVKLDFKGTFPLEKWLSSHALSDSTPLHFPHVLTLTNWKCKSCHGNLSATCMCVSERDSKR